MTDLDAPAVSAPTRFPIEITRFVFGTVEPMVQHWHRTWREALESSN